MSGCDGRHLVVAVGADDEEMARLGVGHEVLEEPEARRVGPLEVVEEERERVLLPGEHADEAAGTRGGTGSAPRPAAARATGGCGPMTSSSCGITSTMSWPLIPRASSSRCRHAAIRVLALGEDLEHELPEGLDERGVGDVALVLIELAREEEARARATIGLCSSWTSDDLPMPGVAGDQHELRGARGDHALEGASSAATPPRARRASAGSGSGPRRRARPAGTARSCRSARHSREAPLEIVLEPARALVALLGHLGEELQDDAPRAPRAARGRARRAAAARGRRGSGPTPAGRCASNGSRPVSIS